MFFEKNAPNIQQYFRVEEILQFSWNSPHMVFNLIGCLPTFPDLVADLNNLPVLDRGDPYDFSSGPPNRREL